MNNTIKTVVIAFSTCAAIMSSTVMAAESNRHKDRYSEPRAERQHGRQETRRERKHERKEARHERRYDRNEYRNDRKHERHNARHYKSPRYYSHRQHASYDHFRRHNHGYKHKWRNGYCSHGYRRYPAASYGFSYDVSPYYSISFEYNDL